MHSPVALVCKFHGSDHRPINLGIHRELFPELLGQRIAQHRLEQNRTQAELAHEAGVSKRTIERLEGGESIHTTNLIRVLRVLGLLANLNELVPALVPSPLEALRSMEKRRKRASGRAGVPGKRLTRNLEFGPGVTMRSLKHDRRVSGSPHPDLILIAETRTYRHSFGSRDQVGR